MQIQAMKLLEVPAAQLEQRIKEEMEDNPLLEIDNSPRDDADDSDDDTAVDEQDNKNTSIEEYLKIIEETPAYKLKVNNFSADDKHDDVPFTVGISFYEHLEEQIGLQDFTEEQAKIARYIIGNIDEDGYLRRTPNEMADDISFATNEDVTVDEVNAVLKVVQQFDPVGVGASSLQECLILQMRTHDVNDPIVALSLEILTTCYEEFTKKLYDKIMRRLHIDDKEQLRQALDEILRLNPKPGSNYSGAILKASQPIIPDFIVEFDDNKLTFRLNSRNDPELRISSTYMNLLRKYARHRDNQSKDRNEVLTFVRQKFSSAKWFIDSLRQRRDTLSLVMGAILEYQRAFFEDGDESKLRPMILKDIAKMTNLDASTISRVSNSKYVQTPFGIFSLKYFFSEAIQSTEGEDVSSREVKKILAESVADEDKQNPLTDDRLAEILASKSYNIARRTVAKYREQLGIPVARLRKKL